MLDQVDRPPMFSLRVSREIQIEKASLFDNRTNLL